MEKIIINPWYVKKYITLLIFIALVMTVTFLKRMSVTDGDSPSLLRNNAATQQSVDLREPVLPDLSYELANQLGYGKDHY